VGGDTVGLPPTWRDPGQGCAWALAIAAARCERAVSFWQEYRAEEAFLALQRLPPHEVTTLREGVAASQPMYYPAMDLLKPGTISRDCRVRRRSPESTRTVTANAPRCTDASPSPDGDLPTVETPLAGTTVVPGSGRACSRRDARSSADALARK
jgi:hypothetical protein